MASSGLFQELFLLETEALIVSNSQGIERFLITSLKVRSNVIYRMYLTAPPMLKLKDKFTTNFGILLLQLVFMRKEFFV